MKVALINSGNNVQGFKTTPASETLYIAECLRDAGVDVDVITLKANDYALSYDDVPDPNVYDRLLVLNGSINFFGGKENTTNTRAHMFMTKYKSKIYYLLTDTRLPFAFAWKLIKKKPWHVQYTPEQFDIKSKMTIVSQGKSLDFAAKIHKKPISEGLDADFIHFTLDKHKMYCSAFKVAEPTEKTCDLIYGGTFRSGNREEKMVDYLFNKEINVEFFGSVKAEQFKNPKFPWTTSPSFPGKIDSREMVARNSTAYATIVIGDKNYNDNQITPRVWEALASDAVAFFDKDFDTNKSIMGDDYFYVSDGNELQEKIKEIKNDESLRKSLIEKQHKVLQGYLDQRGHWYKDFKRVLDIK